MAQMPNLLTINGIATELNMDRRAVARLLRATPPDGTTAGHKTWLLSTVLTAMQQQRRGGNSAELRVAADEIETLARKLGAGLGRLEKIKNLDGRRKAAEAVGPMIGGLDRLMAEANAMCPAHELDLLEMVRDKIGQEAVGQLMALCRYRLGAKSAAA
jgi:hypothetical protein